MNKYEILVNILDNLRREAPAEYHTYHCSTNNVDDVSKARSRAFIHLYLKASLGVLSFQKREEFLTDGTDDGGIDAYYIDENVKTILFIQSKFRNTQENFQNKKIDLEEILKMDIDRVLRGERTYESGVKYNHKILRMQQKINTIPDIARYSYKVIVLANFPKIDGEKIKILTGGYPFEIFNHERTFSSLVFPVVCGTYYNASDLHISIKLNGDTSSSHIDYSVETLSGDCEITVIFMPLLEVGRIMYEYKNSILKYNPRSYMTLKEGSVNDAIMKTALTSETNEFALFNNGITFVSDETNYNHRIGQKNKARLTLKNPQIINGGQTAYTLSLIYHDAISKSPEIWERLQRKEVLTRIITFNPDTIVGESQKINLIEAISNATNSQNFVNVADKHSNNPALNDAQRMLFNDFGILLEKKRGEFFDGISSGYISKSDIIDRNIFMRIAFASLGQPIVPKKEKRVFIEQNIDRIFTYGDDFKRYYFGCVLYAEFLSFETSFRNTFSLDGSIYLLISIAMVHYYDDGESTESLSKLASKAVKNVADSWRGFLDYASTRLHNRDYFLFTFNFMNKTWVSQVGYPRYFRSKYVLIDINDYYFESKPTLEEDPIVRRTAQSVEGFMKSRHLTTELLRIVEPVIDLKNWYDPNTIEQITGSYDYNQTMVRNAIKYLTSKEYGYYFYAHLHLSDQIPMRY